MSQDITQIGRLTELARGEDVKKMVFDIIKKHGRTPCDWLDYDDDPYEFLMESVSYDEYEKYSIIGGVLYEIDFDTNGETEFFEHMEKTDKGFKFHFQYYNGGVGLQELLENNVGRFHE